MTHDPDRVWRCGPYELPLDTPLVMGILNVTPDSFSDGGEHDDRLSAMAHARKMLAAGADLIDVGGESTRPGSEPVEPAEEIARVCPVLSALACGASVPLSVDTRRAEVASAAIEVGANIINDVSGFRDPAMIEVAAASDVGVIVMHMLGEPGTMQADPRYSDVVSEVRDYLLAQARKLEEAGIGCERIAIDPGIGFGKTLEHNLALLGHIDEFAGLGYCVVLGASRKRFIGEVTGVAVPRDRVAGSVAAAIWGATHGADVVRVHDVAETLQALRVTVAIEG